MKPKNKKMTEKIRKENLDTARKYMVRLRNLIEDIKLILKNPKLDDKEKLNTIYSLILSYDK